jgi:predicted Zn-dependent protease
MKKYQIVVALIAIVFLGCQVNPVTGKKEIVLMSEEQEIQMGKEAYPEIIAQYGLYDNPALQDYINKKGQEIVAVSHRKNIKYTFKILDADFVNAFATPGGYVYFSRQIMAYFNNEAQFTGVLGHEIGHITARHSVEQQRNQVLGQLGILTTEILVPELRPLTETASQGLGLLFLKFGRDAERQADQLGVEYSSRIGYDADEMAGFFNTLKRMEQQSGSNVPVFLSTHPDPGARYETVKSLAVEWKNKLHLTQAKVNRNDFLKLIAGITYGKDPKQGYVENNIFYQPDLKIQLPIPNGWNYENESTKFQMSSKNGDAILQLTILKSKSLQEAANEIEQQFSMQSIDSKNISVNGLNAISLEGNIVQQQNSLHTLSYIIQFAGNLYHVMGAASSNSYNNNVSNFRYTLDNFKEIKDISKINKKSERIVLKEVTKSVTLAQALKTFGMPDSRIEELSILNGMKSTDNVGAGSLIKVIGN